jgi:hypothetical protein
MTDVGETPFQVEVQGRWDAVALADVLAPFHSFMVQRGDARWIVHARAPGCRGESFADALVAVAKWRATSERRAA